MFDAILLASYGGPESVADVEPFLTRVLAGKRVPQARLDSVVARYMRFGGKSPLPEECRAFLTELKTSFAELAPSPRVYWGNLFASPTFEETFEQIERDGIQKLLVFPTSAFGTVPSCKRYRDAVERAFASRSSSFRQNCVVAHTPPFFDAAPFLRAVCDSILTAVAWTSLDADPFNEEGRPQSLLLFTAHSVPTADDLASRYRRQLLTATTSVLKTLFSAPSFSGKKEDVSNNGSSIFSNAPLLEDGVEPPALPEEARRLSFDVRLAFQSRSGSPATPWLEPSAEDALRKYRSENPALKNVVVVPIGFFFENMETIFDLDVELRGVCDGLGLSYHRARCCGSSRFFVRFATDLVQKEPSAFPVCALASGTCDLSCRSPR